MAALHPIYFNVLEFLLISSIIGTTGPRSPLRPVAFSVLLAAVIYSIPRAYVQIKYPFLRTVLASESVTRLVHFFDLALISRWSYSTDGPSTPNPYVQYANRENALSVKWRDNDGTVSDMLRFGATAALGHRFCGKKYQTKNVPPFKRDRPAFIPSKRRFLWHTGVGLAACYLLIDLMTSNDTPQDAADFAPGRVPLLSRLSQVTLDEIVVRTWVSIGTLVSIYLTIGWMRGMVAVTAVGLGLSEASSWRPVWGSVHDACSLRGFWGTFWHQLDRQRFTSVATWFTYGVLGFRKGGIPGRYLALFLVFLLSGSVHAAAEVASGREAGRSHAVHYFLTQFLGIVVEDGVGWVTRQGRVAVSEKIAWLGYVWVLAFQVWTIPMWIYPDLEGKTGDNTEVVVPISIARWLS